MKLKASPRALGICALVWIAMVLATVALGMPSTGPLTISERGNPFWDLVPTGMPSQPFVAKLDLMAVSLAALGPLAVAALVIKLGPVTGFGRWAKG
ncbi:hypothetical protein H4F99_13620 [Lysobacter sp. SG-8]|uniref:Uncharacterized protein n=1 Tax=Marilutibacter penaei TaxID=2759900 RepID=A0A7W3U602_9GAMM|nr:hypothetical protein [Lysobacter penaei]MBB1089518.1 hypothetical protein [Lysobacter penaei]